MELKTLVWVVMLISAIVMVVLILMQHGKGADAGAAFGSGSAQGVFGASGSANFLSKTTAYCAIIFISSCLYLAYSAANANKNVLGLQDGQKATVSQPAAPVEQKPNTASGVIPE